MADFPHGLGRIPSPRDSKDWKLERYLLRPPPKWKSRGWKNPQPVLDQGAFGTCVGNGWAQYGNTLPICDAYTESDARAIYYEATVIAGDPDNPDAPGGGQQGTNVRAGAKAMKRRGRIGNYAFTTLHDTIVNWLLTRGSLVVGTDWYYAMAFPERDGLIRIDGELKGGHCYLLRSIKARVSGDYFGIQNSWGPKWGQGGYAKILVADFMRLLARQGECCAAVELPLEAKLYAPSRGGDRLQMTNVLPDNVRNGIPDRIVRDTVYPVVTAEPDSYRYLDFHIRRDGWMGADLFHPVRG